MDPMDEEARAISLLQLAADRLRDGKGLARPIYQVKLALEILEKLREEELAFRKKLFESKD